jgi:DNA-binding NarL/FixJ family response regulator
MTENKQEITVALVDDQQLFRNGLSAIIRDDRELHLLYEAESAAQLLLQLETGGHLPDVLVMDMSMPGMNGMELHAILQEKYPAIKVLVVSMHDQPRFIVKMIEQGASGYLSKNTDAQELLQAIKTIAGKGFYFNEAMRVALQKGVSKKSGPLKSLNDIPIELTNRESEIVQLICREYSTEEMADKLSISVRTVEGHRQNILLKIGCKNVAGLVVFAIKKELFTLIP